LKSWFLASRVAGIGDLTLIDLFVLPKAGDVTLVAGPHRRNPNGKRRRAWQRHAAGRVLRASWSQHKAGVFWAPSYPLGVVSGSDLPGDVMCAEKAVSSRSPTPFPVPLRSLPTESLQTGTASPVKATLFWFHGLNP